MFAIVPSRTWRRSRLERMLHYPFESSASSRWVRNTNLSFSEKSNHNWRHVQKEKISDRKLHRNKTPTTKSHFPSECERKERWGWSIFFEIWCSLTYFYCFFSKNVYNLLKILISHSFGFLPYTSIYLSLRVCF